jgi:hypothetical protein
MADKPNDNPLPRGVRGPGGPPRPTPGSRPSADRSPARLALEDRSRPLLRRLHALPRWLVVITPAILLFGGLIFTGAFAWIGGLLLLLVAVFLAWLTALSWPAISGGARFIRVVVVLALLGLTVLKFMGRF